MSIPLTPNHLAYATAHPLRVAVIALLSDPAGPLGDCAARPEDAPAAYMLARIYRHARAQGHLHGKPGFEAEALFATRVRSTVRSSTDPFAFAEKLARALGLRWDALAEDDRLWWRGESRRLTASPDGVSLLTDWSALDVHAYLWREGVPLLPVYLCVDPGADALALRKSWWVCGGGPARNGSHYGWLRRWWPGCWRLAVEIDPEVAHLS